MENGSYRAPQVDEVTTSNWVTLNFDSMPQRILESLMRNGDELTKEFPELEEPEEDDFETEEEFQAALTEWEEECEARAENMGLPMWGTMWIADASGDIMEDLLECGFDVFTPNYGVLAECYDGCVLFGVDGAGYSFYGGHWIPLRATRICRSFEAGYLTEEELVHAFAKLTEEARQEGESEHRLQRILSNALASKTE